MPNTSSKKLLPPMDRGSVKEALQSIFVRNVGFKVLSVIFAVALWAWVQGERVVEVKAKVHMSWSLPEKLVPSIELPENVIVTVSGSQVLARNVRKADLRMKVDLSEAVRGRQTVELQDRPIENLANNVRVLALSPSLLEFNLESRAEKKVRLSPQVVGEPASGFRVSGVTVEPEKVLIMGPQSVLSDIDEASTSPVDVTGTRENVEQVVTLEGLARNVTFDDKPAVVKVAVVPVASRRILGNVPVVVRTRGWASPVDPVTVALEGPIADLDAIRPEEVTVVIQVEPDAPRETLSATPTSEVARYKVVHPYADKVQVALVKPGVITIEPID